MARVFIIFGIILAIVTGISLGATSDPFPFIYLAVAAGLLTWTQPLWSRHGRNLHTWLSVPRALFDIEFRPFSVLIEVTIALGFLGAAAAIFPHQALGDRPIDHDHPVHFFRAWQFRELLLDGRLFGWSHRWFAGNPFEYLYPFGTEALVVSVWAIGFGLWSLDTAYALMFVIFWALQGWSTYYAGKTFINRGTGLFAGLFVLLDTGAFRFGGWVFAGQWGVWPNSLAIALGMIGISQLPAIIQGKDRQSMAVFAIFMGLSLLTHPLQLVHLLVLFLVAIVALITSERDGSRVLGIVRLFVSSAFACFIGSLWLLPFFDTKEYSENYGEPWLSAHEMGVQLYAGKLLEGTWYLAAVLAMLGTATLLRDRKFKPSLVALMTFFCLAGASTWFISAFNLAALSESLTYLQYQRFAMILKPYAFIAAGAALMAIIKMASTTGSPSPIRMFLIALLGAPILVGWVEAIRSDQLTRNFTELSEAPYQQARADLSRWLTDDWETREVPFYRVEVRMPRHDHSFVDFGTQIPMPIYKSGFTPAETFSYKVESGSLSDLDALNVRYVVTTSALSEPFSLIKDFGENLKLYRYENWKPDPFLVTGKGKVELVSWSDEHIVLRAHAGASGTLRLNVTNFSRWHVTRDNEPVDIQSQSLPGEKDTAFMTVPLTPGLYVFEFRTGLPERLGLLLFIIAVAACGLLLWSNRRKNGLGFFEVPFLHLASLLADADDQHRKGLHVLVGAGFFAVFTSLILLAVWDPTTASSALSKVPPTGIGQEDIGIVSNHVGAKLVGTPQRPSNVVVIILESTRASATTLDNPGLNTTPFLTRLAARSLVATKAYAIIPHTSKALVAILCGFEPYLETPIVEATKGLPGPCLPGLLKDHGYSSLFLQGTTQNFESRRQLVARLGFEDFQSLEDFAGSASVVDDLGNEALLRPMNDWLAKQSSENPFFLTMLATNPVLEPPVSKNGKQAKPDSDFDRYLQGVNSQDRYLESVFGIFDKLDLTKDTIFVVVGGHGEAFGEHGRYQHDNVVYDEGIHVPLMVFDGRDPEPMRIKVGTSHLDVVPTIAARSGFSLEGAKYDGADMTTLREERMIPSHCWLSEDCMAASLGGLKYIHYFGKQTDEIFNLDKDPQEKTNLKYLSNEADTLETSLMIWRKESIARYQQFYGRIDAGLMLDEAPPVQNKVDVKYENGIRLVGSNMSWRGGDLAVELVFQTDERLPKGSATGLYLGDGDNRFYGVPDPDKPWVPMAAWPPKSHVLRHFLIKDATNKGVVRLTMSVAGSPVSCVNKGDHNAIGVGEVPPRP
jgi:arylsulfatase A-like enzyme